MKRRLLIGVTSALMVLAFMGICFGQRDRGPGRGPGMGGMGPGLGGEFMDHQIGAILRFLDLSQEQKDAIKLLVEEHKASFQEERDQIRTNYRALMEATTEAEVSRIALEQGHLLGQALEANSHLRLKIRNEILTPVQVEQLDNLKPERGMRPPPEE